MDHGFTVRRESEPDVRRTVVFVSGEVDLDTADELRAALDQSIVTRPGNDLVVDLTEVPFLDSSGIRVLLECRTAALAGGGRLVVRNPGRMVARVLDVTGVASVLGLPSPGDSSTAG